MNRFKKLFALTAVFFLGLGTATAWAGPTSETPPGVKGVLADGSVAAAPALAPPATPRPSLRASVEALRQSALVPLPARPERSAKASAQPGQPGGGRRMGAAAKAAIWAAAVTVTSVWAYKTFSETRGTD